MAEYTLYSSVRAPVRSERTNLEKILVCELDRPSDPYHLQSKAKLKEILAALSVDFPEASAASKKIWQNIIALLGARADQRQAIFVKTDRDAASLRTHPYIFDQLDRWLTGQRDAPPLGDFDAQLKELATKIGADLKSADSRAAFALAIASQPKWHLDRLILGALLVDSLYRPFGKEQDELRGRLLRMTAVAAFIESIAAGVELLDPLTIANLLNRRPAVLAPTLLNGLKRNSNLARRPAVSDHFVVSQVWDRYELGEISSIEPLMAGEVKSRLFERVEASTDMQSSSTSRDKLTENSTQSDDRFELSNQLTTLARQESTAEGWINVDAASPTVKIGAHAGGSVTNTSETARDVSSRAAHELVSKAITRIQETAQSFRAKTSGLTITDRAMHEFKNPEQISRNGIYRWVNRVDSVSLTRYPNRYLFELQIPEPGAWAHWLLKGAFNEGALADPGPFPNSLRADGITITAGPTNYIDLGNRFGADSLPPPPETKIVSAQVVWPKEGDEEATAGLTAQNSVAIPDGYQAVSWKASVIGQPSDVTKTPPPSTSDTPWFLLALGAGPIVRAPDTLNYFARLELNGTIGAINEGLIPIAIANRFNRRFVANFEIRCEPTNRRLMEWRFDIFSILHSSHERRRSYYRDALAEQALSGSRQPSDISPGHKREIMINEIKRLTIEMLTDEPQEGFIGMEVGGNNPPKLSRTAAKFFAPYVQFVEQAFEWSAMSFVFYPTYWAFNSRWEEMVLRDDPDPDFARFLRAGSVRVVVPARPGYEYQTQLFVDYGLVWGGGLAPGPDNDDYVSVATEIEEIQNPTRSGELVRTWSVTTPTMFVAIDPEGKFPLTNPST